MLRIIAGEARRVQLEVPEGTDVRPTQDKIKGAIFSAIGDLTGAKVLDLCSGSGNLGLEALSRGACEVVMIEQVPRFASFIKSNLEKVTYSILGNGLRSAEDFTAKVVIGSALEAPRLLAHQKNHYDVILADPPYVPEKGQKGPVDFITSTDLAEFVSEETIFMLESGPDLFGKIDLDNIPWQLIRKKNYGTTTTVSFWRLKQQ